MDASVAWACLNHTERMISSASNGETFRDLGSLKNDGPQCKSLFSISDHLPTTVFNVDTDKPSITAGSTGVPM
jgi:hypothetical protein